MRLRHGLALGLLTVVAAFTFPAGATESGGGAYPNGAEDFMVGALPPPGQYFMDYCLYYSASDLLDGKGHRIASSADSYELMVLGDVLRYIHVSKATVLGASWAQHVFVPFMEVDVTAPLPLFENGQMVGLGSVQDDKFGIGDIIVDPFILGWHSANLHAVVGLDTYVPVGAYNESDVANIGRGYWTFEPVVAFTWLCPMGLDWSAKFMYDFNLENPDTDYQSGEEFHFDYTLGKKVGNLSVGAGGFYYEQVTDDDGPMVAADGNKGKSMAVGPQLAYQHKNMSLGVKVQKEFNTENKFEGMRTWLKFLYCF